MVNYTQANRPLSVTTPLGKDALLLVGLKGHEALSRPFSFQLDLLAPGSPVAFDRLVGQPATVRLEVPGSGKRYVNGIVSRLTQRSRVRAPKDNATFLRYRMELVPRLWLLTRRFQSRILQHLSVPDILRQVLQDEWGLAVDFRLTERFDPRVRCVQYRETDFAFVSRLMEEEGLHYSFEHADDAHRLIIGDGLSAPPQLQNPNPLTYDEVAGGFREEARVTRWEKTQEMRACEYTLWDHCFEFPGRHLEATEHVRDTVAAGKAKHRLDLKYRVHEKEMLEIYEYPGGYSHRFDGISRNGAEQPAEIAKVFQDNQRTAKVRIQQEAAQALTVEGGSYCGHLEPGRQFALERHFDADDKYLLTAVEHDARLEGTYLGGEEGFHYENTFRCLPVALPYRPPLTTPRPRVGGTQTATVVGPKGTEIHCDKYGRVKVQFHWDRTDYEKAQGGSHVLHDSSCWVRVGQAWAGKGYGAIHVPRVGQEVIVDFLEGDPDKPIIVGSVYNAEQVAPYALPKYRTHSGLKTQTRGGGPDDFSHLTFEDYQGGEHVHLHSQQDMTHSAEQHLVQNVGDQHHLHVGKAAVRQVGGLPGLDHALWVGKDRAVGGVPTTGSGSGGGNGNGSSSGPYYTISPSQIWGTGWASSLDTVFGWRTGNTVGLYTTLKVGVNQSTTFNPFAVFDFVPDIPANLTYLLGAFPLTDLLRNAMGAINVVIGANATIHYGRKIDVSRGAHLKNNAQSGNPNYKATVPAALLYSLAVITEVFLPAEPAPLAKLIGHGVTTTEMEATLAGATVALDLIAFSVWAGLEYGCAAAEFFPKYSDTLLATAAMAVYTGLPQKWAAFKQGVQALVASAVAASSGPAEDLTDETHASDSAYTISAPSVALFSSPNPTLNAEDPVGILLQANGLEGTDGEVVVCGTGKATLIGGDQAIVQCLTEEEVTGKVTLDCGEVGTIALQSGLAQEPNALLLNPEGISLTSLLEVKAAVEENSVTLNPAMISLSSGPSSIEITPEGITISCGPSSLAITPEGVTLSGPTVSISGDAIVNIG